MSQINGINNAQTAAAAGNVSSAGKLGSHTVQIGKNPPFRLDQIKGNKIPFAGFRTAAKVASAKTGAQDNAAAVLKAFVSSGGQLDAKALLNAAKSLQTHLDRLNKLGEIRGNMDNAVLAAFAPEVESLSNTELLTVYQQLYSSDMASLKRALQHEAAVNPGNADAMAASANLALLEALVTLEAGNRIISAQGLAEPDKIPSLTKKYGSGIQGMREARRQEDPRDMSAVSMQVVMDIERESSVRGRQAENIAADTVQKHNIGSGGADKLGAKAFGDVMRSAGLTINANINFFFGMGGTKPLLKAGGAWDHIFHMVESASDEAERRAAIDVKGAGYLYKRDQVERSFFTEFGEDRNVVAKERPTYAALNLAQFKSGGAANYGAVALHLKPEVARRATYTVEDTFVKLRLRYTDKGRDAIWALLPNFSGISPQNRVELMKEGSPLRQRFDGLLDYVASEQTVSGNVMRSKFAIPELSDDENIALAGLFIQCFKDVEANRSVMASYDTLETLLPELGEADAVSLARAALEKQQNGDGKLVCGSCNYIEAQIHGPLVFSRDVAEIVILKDYGYDLLKKDEKIWVQAVVAVLQGQKPGAAVMNALTPERLAELAQIKEQLGGAVIPVKFVNQTAEFEEKLVMEAKQRDYYLAHFDQSRFDASLRDIQDDAKLKAFIDSELEFYSGGSAIAQVLNGRQLIADEDLPRLKEAYTALIGQFRHNPVKGQASEKDLMRDCLYRALEEVAGKERLQSLAAVASLTADPVRQAVLVDFVTEQPPMASKAFTVLASSALQGAAALGKIASGDAVTDADLAAEFGKTALSFRKAFEALPKNVQESTGENRLLQSLGQLAFAVAAQTNPRMEDLLAERLNAPAVQRFSGVLLRLGDVDKGFLNSPVYKDIIALNALQDGFRRVLAEKAHEPAVFSGELSLIPQADRDLLRSALPDAAAVLDTAFPVLPAFPAALKADFRLTPAQHREFLLSMLPVYHEHEKPGAFDHGTAYHGRGHICRAFIFAATMAGIMETMGHTVDKTALLCGIAGHDAGRSSNGADTVEQETESARLALDKMHELFGADTFGEAYEAEFAHAIVGHASPTLESLLLNAADSLDIGRVKDFDFKYFPFLRGGTLEGPRLDVPEYAILREKLHNEADLLARMTDPITQIRELRGKLLEEGEFETMRDMGIASSEAVKEQYPMGNKEFLEFVENKIRSYPDMFPLLNRFYLKPFAESAVV